MKRTERAEASRKSLAVSAVGVTLLLLFARSGAGAELLQVGDTFPAWKLTDHTGKQVTSEELSGHTYVLWFYPMAMTPGCTAEGQGFRDKSDAFSEQGVVIFGVSFDTPDKNAKFVDQESFPLPASFRQRPKVGRSGRSQERVGPGFPAADLLRSRAGRPSVARVRRRGPEEPRRRHPERPGRRGRNPATLSDRPYSEEQRIPSPADQHG